MSWKTLILVAGGMCALPLVAQVKPSALITQKIDESKLVTLHGSVHPLAQARDDRGAVPDSFAAERLILMLNRPPEREAALAQFLKDVNARGSASFHQWLTPEQFGQRFGVADADLATASAWLSSHGFRVARVTKSKALIEFSGNAGQVRGAFHTEIHQYAVAGASHYANASEIKIPAALTGLVRGLAPMNNFRATPDVKVQGAAHYARRTGRTTTEWTAPNQYGTANPYEFTVTPEDFATQYDLAPLYQAGVKGAGQTIGIINESNIDLGLVQGYQSLFGVAGNTPEVVIDGDDPGDVPDVDVEAYLDVELSGAVAPQAAVNLYISNGSELEDPLALAAIRAIEDNQASVLSVSFGQCEYYLGNAGNQLWAGLWEQAAAQGQTVVVSAGDSGSQCNFQTGWVSGLASTPWNVAVGGTDFYYSDYASGGSSATSFWNLTNDANLGSLKAPLTEQPWNDPLGLDVIGNGIERNEFGAGGGGASDCITVSATTGACLSGYAKPSWQSGPGVPPDKVRDLPDVSLFASNGANLSAYGICAYAGECATGSGDDAAVLLVGGTSASAPAMAGIMALVDQKYGRQGQANYTLYALAQQSPAVFHDIILGSNSEVCGSAASAECVLQANGFNGTPEFPAGPNYDMATGLGSVDANALVTHWNSITFQATATLMKLSSDSVTHGTPITLTAQVTPVSGSGTPSGDVAILTNSPLPASQGELFIPLSNGAGSGSVNYLPGGSYQVIGRYGGDGIFASSTSTPVALTVKPENSAVHLLINSGQAVLSSGANVPYNAPLTLNIQPTGVSAGTNNTDGNATGSGTFKVDSITATEALNGVGVASWTTPALAVGSHTASASYSGDSSFNASTSSPFTFTVTKGLPSLNMNIIDAPSTIAPVFNVSPGGSLTLAVQVGPQNGVPNSNEAIVPGTAAPTGTVTVCLGPSIEFDSVCLTPNYSQTATLASPSGIYGQYSSAIVTFANLAAGYYVPTFEYNGDANWQARGLMYLTTIDVAAIAPLTASTTTLTISPNSISGTQAAQMTTTVAGAGSSGIAPTGIVYYYNNGNFLTYDFLTAASSGATSSISFDVTSAWFWNSGSNQVTAIYLGDNNYLPSTSSVANITANQTAIGDFTIAAQAPEISVTGGASGSVGLNLASTSTQGVAVTLTCAPSSSQITCSVSPATQTVNGQATAMLTIQATAQTGTTAARKMPGKLGWPAGAGMLCAGVFLIGGRDQRKLWRKLLFCLCLVAVTFTTGCGVWGSFPSQSHAVTYSVVVTGTGNGITHNAKVTVVVP